MTFGLVDRRCALVAAAFSAAFSPGCSCSHKPGDGNNNIVAAQGVPNVPKTLNFGNIAVGQRVQKQLALQNTGDAPLDVTAQTIADDTTSSFTLVTPFSGGIASGAETSANLQFAPSQSGPISATLDLSDDGSPDSVQVQLTGVGVDIETQVVPSSVDFGPVQVGVNPAPTQQVTFTNVGKGPATIAVDPSATLAVFTVTDANGPVKSSATQTLAPQGGSYSVTVTFEPTAVQTYSSSFAYTACQPGVACLSPQAVPLAGQGVNGALCFSPSPVGWSNVPGGQTASQTVTITNCGSNSLSLTCLYLNSTGNGTCDLGDATFSFSGFSQAEPTPGAPLVLAVNDTLSFSIAYTSSGNASGDSDTLEADWVAPSAPGGTGTDQLLGDQSLSPCSLSVTPASVNFGTVTVSVPVSKTVQLSNTGQQACSVTNIQLGPSSDPSYSLPASTPSTLSVPAGSNASITVDFNLNNSSTPLLRRGTLDFSSNDPNNPTVSVPLSANIAAANAYANGWPKWHYDNNNSGQTTADTSANNGTIVWKHTGLMSAATLTKSGNPEGWTTGDNGCAFSYLQGPVVADDPNQTGVYTIYQMGLDGTLYAFAQDGGVLWSTMTSDPSTDPHPSTPAVVASGDIWAVSGSDAYNEAQKKEAHLDALFYLSSAGSILFEDPYGKDGFDACPGLSPDGTLFEADDNARPDGGTSALGAFNDEYSAIAFQASGSSVTLETGLYLPLTTVSERFGVAIGSDDSSYWGNNGQFFAVTPPSSGFGLNASWPAGGVTIASNKSDANAIGPVFSDLALDPNVTQFVFAYSAWDDGACTGGGYYNYGNCTGPYTVQGTVAALSMATGTLQWQASLPATALPSTWTYSCSDYGNAAPAVGDNGMIYVGNADGLHALDAATGASNWVFKSANVTSAPAIGGDGTVFFGCADGTFYAVDGMTGAQKFSVSTGYQLSNAPAIADDGTVFFVSDDGTLWAVK